MNGTLSSELDMRHDLPRLISDVSDLDLSNKIKESDIRGGWARVRKRGKRALMETRCGWRRGAPQQSPVTPRPAEQAHIHPWHAPPTAWCPPRGFTTIDIIAEDNFLVAGALSTPSGTGEARDQWPGKLLRGTGWRKARPPLKKQKE